VQHVDQHKRSLAGDWLFTPGTEKLYPDPGQTQANEYKLSRIKKHLRYLRSFADMKTFAPFASLR
jgi:hypothetical protein